jgi:PIN domain nuclease of toxin-antitoxin system
VNILLDTCVFLWVIKGDSHALSKKMRESITDPSNQVYLSCISVWEILLKNYLGKLPLPSPCFQFVTQQRDMHRISSLGLDEDDLEFLPKLGSYHRDPFDRVLICQALTRKMTIATTDQLIMQYPVPVLN